MKNTILFKLIFLTVVIAVIEILYVLAPMGMTENLVVMSSAVLFAASVGNLFYAPFLMSKNKTNTSRIGSIGIITFFGLGALALSSYALYKTFESYLIVENILNIAKSAGLSTDSVGNKHLTIPCILNIATLTFFLLQYFVTKVSVNILDDIDEASNFRSAHSEWGRKVNEIALTSSAPEMKNLLMAFSEEFKFLARDPNSFITDINQSIDDALATLAVAVNSKNELEVSQVVSRIKTLLATREQQLKDSRSKV